MLTVKVNVDKAAIAAYAEKYLQSVVSAQIETSVRRVTESAIEDHLGRAIDEALNTPEFRDEVDKTVGACLSAAGKNQVVLEALRNSMVRYAVRQSKAPGEKG